MAANYSVHSPPGVIVTVSGTQITYLPCAKAYEWTGQFSKPSSKKKNSNVIYLLKTNQHNATRQLRDRPFNLKGGGYVFLFRSKKMFRTTRELEYFIFFCRAKCEFFFQNTTLGYMTKTLNQIIFFPPPKSEYFFQQHWESEYFFRKKTITPPQVKWSFPNTHRILALLSRLTRVKYKELVWLLYTYIFHVSCTGWTDAWTTNRNRHNTLLATQFNYCSWFERMSDCPCFKGVDLGNPKIFPSINFFLNMHHWIVMSKYIICLEVSRNLTVPFSP